MPNEVCVVLNAGDARRLQYAWLSHPDLTGDGFWQRIGASCELALMVKRRDTAGDLGTPIVSVAALWQPVLERELRLRAEQARELAAADVPGLDDWGQPWETDDVGNDLRLPVERNRLARSYIAGKWFESVVPHVNAWAFDPVGPELD